ncbi:MAG: hypothetical protein SGARI_005562 [Bacillariaceae sp.]
MMIGVRWIGVAYAATLPPVEATATAVTGESSYSDNNYGGHDDDYNDDEEKGGGATQMVAVAAAKGKVNGDFQAIPTAEAQIVI